MLVADFGMGEEMFIGVFGGVVSEEVKGGVSIKIELFCHTSI